MVTAELSLPSIGMTFSFCVSTQTSRNRATGKSASKTDSYILEREPRQMRKNPTHTLFLQDVYCSMQNVSKWRQNFSSLGYTDSRKLEYWKARIRA